MLKRTRALASVAVGAVALSTAVAVAPAATAAPNAPTTAAARWIADQLDGGLFPGEFGPQYGPSIDAYLTLQRIGDQPAAQAAIIEALEADPKAYVTGEAFGDTGSTYAGATGKLIAAVTTTRQDPTDFGGDDLVDRLTSTIVASGPEAGRASDVSTYGDYSNAIGQSWVVRALAATDEAAPLATTTDYLLKQQCASGQFRDNMLGPATEWSPAVGATCDDDQGNSMSVDATAFGIIALVAARDAGVAGLDDDITDAADWLVSAQGSDGSIAGGANANGTGLAAAALRTAGYEAAAAKASRWVAGLQVTDAVAASSKLKGEAGAVAFDAAALTSGKTSGVGSTRTQWFIATVQSGAELAGESATGSVTGPSSFVAAGRAVRVSVTGLEPGWNAKAVISGGGSSTVAASASGAATFSLTAPKGTATRTVTVTDSRGVRVGSTSVKVLAAKKLSVAAKKKVKRGKVQKVVVKGLAAGETVRVTYRGKVVKRATANGKGAAVVRFKVAKKAGKAKVVVRGAFANRAGVKAFRVVK